MKILINFKRKHFYKRLDQEEWACHPKLVEGSPFIMNKYQWL